MPQSAMPIRNMRIVAGIMDRMKNKVANSKEEDRKETSVIFLAPCLSTILPPSIPPIIPAPIRTAVMESAITISTP